MSQDTDLRETAKKHAEEIAAQAKEAASATAKAEAQRLREEAAGRADQAADAAKAAAGEFDPASLQSEAIRQIADQIEDAAHRIRETDLQMIAQKTSDFARRNPLLFIGAAAVVGFAATRFLKSQSVQPDSSDNDDPWGDSTAYAGSTGGQANE